MVTIWEMKLALQKARCERWGKVLGFIFIYVL